MLRLGLRRAAQMHTRTTTNIDVCLSYERVREMERCRDSSNVSSAMEVITLGHQPGKYVLQFPPILYTNSNSLPSYTLTPPRLFHVGLYLHNCLTHLLTILPLLLRTSDYLLNVYAYIQFVIQNVMVANIRR